MIAGLNERATYDTCSHILALISAGQLAYKAMPSFVTVQGQWQQLLRARHGRGPTPVHQWWTVHERLLPCCHLSVCASHPSAHVTGFMRATTSRYH